MTYEDKQEAIKFARKMMLRMGKAFNDALDKTDDEVMAELTASFGRELGLLVECLNDE